MILSSLDIDVHMDVEVAAIDPELPLKDLVCLNDIIVAVNGVDTHSFTKHESLKLFTNASEEERKISLHRRCQVCEVRVRVDENLYRRITQAILPCIFCKKNPAESKIIKKDNMDGKYIKLHMLGGSVTQGCSSQI